MNASRMFTRCLLALLAVSTLILIGIYWQIYGYDKLFGDFEVFRTAGVHIAGHDLNAVYAIETAQKHYAAHDLRDFSYFVNPPTALFFVYPLAFLSAKSGLILWTGLQFWLLWLLIRSAWLQGLVAPKVEKSVNTGLLLAITLAAFSVQNVLFGQLGVFCGALFLLVLRWRVSRPALAGVALGLFCVKPQLGILLPLLLLIEKNWKVLLVAILTAGALVALSCALWGIGLWRDYREIGTLHLRFMAENANLFFLLSISVFGGLRNAGVATEQALIVQGIVSALTLIALLPVLRKGKESHKIPALIFAAYLITPYVMLYDMVLLAIPCARLLRQAEANKASRSELILLVFLILMPVAALLLQIFHIPYCIIAIGFGFIVARTLALKGQDNGVVSA